jgi:hypothetical protein
MSMCDLELGKARVKKALESDYATWCNKTEYDIDAEKRYKIIFTEGSNYIKVIRTEETDRTDRQSVVGFIVKKATKGFQVGDILKASGWNAPAMNFARGHVEDEELKLNWAGI